MALPSKTIAWIRCVLTCGVLVLGFIGHGSSSSFQFLVKPFRYKTVSFEETLVIDCSTNGTNVTTSLYLKSFKPTYTQLTPSVNPDLVIQGDVFKIRNIKISDGGFYKCKATDGKGHTIEWPQSKGLVIASRDKPPELFVEPNHHIVLTQGESQNVTCKTYGTVAKLTWYKIVNGKDTPIPSSKVVSTYSTVTKQKKTTVMIKDAQTSDSGTFKCVMKYRGVQKLKYSAITVYEYVSPNITSHSKSLKINNRQKVQLKCTIQSHPTPKMKWYKGNKELSIPGCILDKPSCKGPHFSISMNTITKHIKYETTLTITKAVYPDDHGVYRCEASNDHGVDNANIFLDILIKPTLVPNTDPITKAKNLPAKVTCELETSNPTATWTWEFQKQFCIKESDCKPNDEKWIPLPKGHKVNPGPGTASNTSTVTVPGSIEDSFYRCNATNTFGSDYQTRILYRTSDKKAPVFIKNPGPLVYTAGINDVHIACNLLKQFATNGAVWYKDSKQISTVTDSRVTSTERHENDTIDAIYDIFDFTLTNTTANDTGLYTCKAKGQFGIPVPWNDSIQVIIKERVKPNVTGLVSQVVKQDDVDFIELKCENPDANPKPKVTWYKLPSKDSKPSKDQIIQISKGLNNRDECGSRKDGFYFLRKQLGSPLIICNPKHPDFTGWYMCKAENIEGQSSAIAKINILAKADIVLEGKKRRALTIGKPFNITCRANGNPIPKVTWSRTGKSEVLKTGRGLAVLHFKEVKESDLGNYSCKATNFKTDIVLFSFSEDKVKVDYQNKKAISDEAIIGIIVGCIVFVLLVSIICFVVYRRQKKQIEEYKELYFLRTGNSDYKIDPDRSLLDQCNDLPYDMDWEFPEERLILGKPLGAGAFGQVVRAEAVGMAAFKPRDKTPDAVKNRSKLRRSMRESKKKNEYSSMRTTRQTVAVKTLKEGATQNDYKDLASELKILIHLGEHRNIVNILGACTRGRRLMVIIEFAPHGDLLSFLRERRDIYDPNWIKTSNNPDQEFTLVDLGMAAYQISRGMEFLASRKCVHRDLAARNILVGKDFVMKISDFGLARDIYKDDLYVKTTSGLLPVKWMAMESLFDRVYTEKSDVWSFGIVLWEIFTLGGNPYPGLPTEQLLDYLSEGQRMKQPQNCPLEMYAIMRDCWMQFPEQRPEFIVIAERLGKILEKNVSEDNPYIHLEMDEQTGTTDYYLNPCDAFNTQGRQTADGYEEALPTPRPAESSTTYNSPLPTLPPPDSPGYDRPTEPLPSIPPTYEEATKKAHSDHKYRNLSQSSNESGIGIDDKEKIKGAEETEPLIVHNEDETKFSPGRKGKTVESSV